MPVSPSNPNRLRSLGGAAAMVTVLAVFTLTQCVCQNSKSDPPPSSDRGAAGGQAGTGDAAAKVEETVEVPGSIDTKDLDNDEKKVLVSVLEEQFDPCGRPRSFLDALKDDEPCARAVELGNFAVGLVARGLSKKQAILALLKEIQRTTSKADFVLDGSPFMGDPSSKKVLVKFSDFQCPSCKQVSKPLKELAKKYGAVLYIKHLPLDFHEHAMESAKASMAAERQGKFWEMYAGLFDAQDSLDPTVIRSVAKSVGLDMAQFEKDIKSAEIEGIIKRDMAESDQFEVGGTPTIYLNGIMVRFDNLEEKLAELE